MVVSETKVSLSRGKCIHANDGQTWKVAESGDTVGISIFPMNKHIAGVDGIQNFCSVRFFAHQAQVHQVSLNGIWR